MLRRIGPGSSCVRSKGRTAWLTSVGLAATALASLAWTGHGAAGEAGIGWLQLVADIVHLLAAGAWVGALAALVSIVTRSGAKLTPGDIVIAHRTLAGFATAGSVIIALLVATGLINSWILVGPKQILDLAGDPYGRLLAAKLALFAVMLALAVKNRFALVPALGRAIDAGADPVATLTSLRRSVALEAGLAAAVLAVVAWLGTLPPPMAL